MSKYLLKGVSWGTISTSSQKLEFNAIENPDLNIFTINSESIDNVCHVKDDIILYLKNQEESEEEQLKEIRFFVKQIENKGDDDGEEDGGGKEALFQKLSSQFSDKKSSSDLILAFNDISLVCPRGKYSINFYPKMAKFHGKTYSFSFNYSSISRCFLLPGDKPSIFYLVIQFQPDRPVIQSVTSYKEIILQFNGHDRSKSVLEISATALNQCPHLNGLKKEYNGKLIEVFTDIARVLFQAAFIAPDQNEFLSKQEKSYIKCSIKAQQGLLYFMKKSLLFIHRPVTYIKIEEIKKIYLNNVGVKSRQFEIAISFVKDRKAVQFLGVDIEDLEPVAKYFQKKNVQISRAIEQKNVMENLNPSEGEEEDQDFVVGEDTEKEEVEENDSEFQTEMIKSTKR